MRPIDHYVEHYGRSHLHPVNKVIHWLCVPCIAFTLLAMLWYVRWPGWPIWANAATLFSLFVLFFYVRLSHALALGAALPSGVLLIGCWLWDSSMALPLWQGALAVFVVAWTLQFVGHGIEGKRPSLFEDLRYLLIGPLWLLSFAYRKAGIRY